MDPGEFQRMLLSVDRELRNNDLRSLKFLVSGFGSIEKQRLENASRNDFVSMLRDRSMISCSDVSLLLELLREIGRHDLCEKLTNIFPDTQTCRLSTAKTAMFRIAKSMTRQDVQNVRFQLRIYDEDSDALELMEFIESQKLVGSTDELRQFFSALGLSHLYDNALSRPATAVLRTLSFCDGTGCKKGCLYRPLWSEKFPHQLAPMFKTERMLSHDDVSTDGENTAEQLIGEGTFGKVYKGQQFIITRECGCGNAFGRIKSNQIKFICDTKQNVNEYDIIIRQMCLCIYLVFTLYGLAGQSSTSQALGSAD